MGVKISDLTAKGSKIASTDIVEVSVDTGSSFVSRKVTGSELNELSLDTSPQLGGNLDVNGNKITSASNGNISIEPNGTGAVVIGGNSTQATELRFMEDSDNGTNYVALKANNTLAANTTYTLPTADGSSGQVLSTNGTGTLSWATAGGGITVGTTAVTSGTDGRVFFQAGGVIQQDGAFFWDNTNKRLGVGATPSTSVRLDIRAQGALSTDIAFRVRNSADTANIVQINGDGSQAWFDPVNNAFTTIRSGASTLIQWGNTNFLNIGIGHGHTMTATDAYNILIGGSSTISSGTSEAIKIGTFGTSTGVGTINIGYAGRVNGSYSIKIGRHTGASSFGGTNSIHLGRTDSGNDITPDNVFMTYFNSQSSSTLTRSNGSFGLLGQQAYILGNGTGTYGVETFMGNGGNTLVVRNHPSVPSTNITDSFQQYSADITAGNAAPHFRTENGAIVKVYQETTAVAASTLVGNAGTNITDTDTFDGYTLKQIVKALRNQGLLA